MRFALRLRCGSHALWHGTGHRLRLGLTPPGSRGTLLTCGATPLAALGDLLGGGLVFEVVVDQIAATCFVTHPTSIDDQPRGSARRVVHERRQRVQNFIGYEAICAIAIAMANRTHIENER